MNTVTEFIKQVWFLIELPRPTMMLGRSWEILDGAGMACTNISRKYGASQLLSLAGKLLTSQQSTSFGAPSKESTDKYGYTWNENAYGPGPGPIWSTLPSFQWPATSK